MGVIRTNIANERLAFLELPIYTDLRFLVTQLASLGYYSVKNTDYGVQRRKVPFYRVLSEILEYVVGFSNSTPCVLNQLTSHPQRLGRPRQHSPQLLPNPPRRIHRLHRRGK